MICLVPLLLVHLLRSVRMYRAMFRIKEDQDAVTLSYLMSRHPLIHDQQSLVSPPHHRYIRITKHNQWYYIDSGAQYESRATRARQPPRASKHICLGDWTRSLSPFRPSTRTLRNRFWGLYSGPSSFRGLWTIASQIHSTFWTLMLYVFHAIVHGGKR